jgi:hypothetical protein
MKKKGFMPLFEYYRQKTLNPQLATQRKVWDNTLEYIKRLELLWKRLL